MSKDLSIGEEKTRERFAAVAADPSVGDASTILSPMVRERFGTEIVTGRIDRYALKDELGRGGFGAVWRAVDEEAQVEVALKMLPPHFARSSQELERVRRNFQLVSRLAHPHIATVRHLHRVEQVDPSVESVLGVAPGEWLVVMEYAPGMTLSSMRACFPHQKMPISMALSICRQIAEGLDFAHREQVIHRDIKPSNIMVCRTVAEEAGNNLNDRESTVKILDFGLAAALTPDQQALGTCGTRPYMAPEQWEGDPQSEKTDQYALAVLFYEMVGGEVPFSPVFTGTNTKVMSRTVEQDDVEPLIDLNAMQNEVLRKALSKTPDSRFGTCGEFVDSLSAAGERAEPTTAPPRFRAVADSVQNGPLPIRAAAYYIRCLEEEARQQSSIRMRVLEDSLSIDGGDEPIFLGDGTFPVDPASFPVGLLANERLVYGFLFYISSREWNGNTYYNADPLFLCDIQFDEEACRFEPVDAHELTINRSVLRRFEEFSEMSHDELDEFLEQAEISGSVQEQVVHILSTIGLSEDQYSRPKPLLGQYEDAQLLCHAAVFPVTTGFYARTVDELIRISRRWSTDAECEGPAWELLQGISPERLSAQWDPSRLSVVASNYEQAEAVGCSLNEDNLLQVVTGPPGTGKSQFILNLIANQTEAGKSVLLASRNNQAVDVVVNRMNHEVARRPFILRTGNDEKERGFAAELNNIGPARSTERQQYDELRCPALAKLETLNGELQELKTKRDEYDRARQQISAIREELLGLISEHQTTAGLCNWYCDEPDGDFGRSKWKQLKIEYGHAVKAGQYLLTRFLSRSLVGGDWAAVWSRPRFSSIIGDQLYADTVRQLPLAVSGLFDKADLISSADRVYEVIGRLTELGEQYRECCRVTGSYNVEDALAEWGRVEIEKNSPSCDLFRGSVLERQADGDVFNKASQILQARPGAEGIATPLLLNGFPACATSSLSVGRRIPLRHALFDLVVIDEASQVDVATILPLLFRARRAVIVGDENQLGPIVRLTDPLDREIAQACNLGDADFACLSHLSSSLFTLAADRVQTAGSSVVMLKDHYRCHPDIIGFSNRHFYKGLLRPLTEKTVDGGVSFHEVNGVAQRKWFNHEEAEHVCSLVGQLLEEGHELKNIGVVTPFRKQVELIRRMLEGRGLVATALDDSITVGTAHTYQGDERKIMILSLVVGADMPASTIRWLHNPLSSSKNLLNVALTRARSRLYIVGSRQLCLHAGGLLEQLVLYCGEVNDQ